MDSDKLSVEEMVEYYKPDVEELAVYEAVSIKFEK